MHANLFILIELCKFYQRIMLFYSFSCWVYIFFCIFANVTYISKAEISKLTNLSTNIKIKNDEKILSDLINSCLCLANDG